MPGRPVKTQTANAPSQKPAFPGQTRAPYLTANVGYEPRVIADGLDHPWAVAFTGHDELLVTEKPGRMRLITAQGARSQPVAGLPPVDDRTTNR